MTTRLILLPPRRFALALGLALGLACWGAGAARSAEGEDGGFLEHSPFIPIPEVGTDPNAGTIVGLLPIYLVTDESKQVRRIYAPDLAYDPNFGWVARGRVFDYPSDDTEWSVVGGMKQRVEREFAADYATGLTRQSDWSLHGTLVYDRNGTQRYYGLGNHSPSDGVTNFTREQTYAEGEIGWNATPHFQIAYLLRERTVNVEQGVLPTLPSIETLYPVAKGLGHGSEFLNRLSVSYDTRNSPSLPTEGSRLVAYAGVAPNIGISNASYSVVGADLRNYLPVATGITLASHLALRIMPDAGNAPFWALSSLGGDRSIIGDRQPLRGFGEGRFVDTNSLAAEVELRSRVLSMDLFSTQVDLELAPFIDTGQVFHSRYVESLGQQHVAAGLGFRAVASPFIVGYVDIGYGTEGTAIFSGIDYPF